MISFAVTAKLICAFVFAYVDCWFFHAASQFILYLHVAVKSMYMYIKMDKSDLLFTDIDISTGDWYQLILSLSLEYF